MLQRGDYDEKRDFARMGMECPAIITVDGKDKYQGVASDLSATGMQLGMANALNEGIEVVVEVTPEQAIVPPLMARAEVVRCKDDGKGGYQLGLKILEMMPGL
jgi:hypothetical protein